jgi:hypothetical protein
MPATLKLRPRQPIVLRRPEPEAGHTAALEAAAQQANTPDGAEITFEIAGN